jgi:glycoprotein endo-alpha-1,2-mannosidase
MILNRSEQRQLRHCRKLFAAIVFLCLCLTGFSQTTNSFFQFVQNQSERHYSNVPHEVLAFYYPWYGQPDDRSPWHGYDTNKHEIFGAQRYPVKGPYSSHDLSVIDSQIDQAKAHGITGFIVAWWDESDWEKWNDQSLSLLLAAAEKKDFKISMEWNIAPGEGEQQIDRAVNTLSIAVKHYGQCKAFLKVDGKPVIFPYNDVMLKVPVASWPKIIEGVRERVGDFLLIADGHQDHYAYLFGGIHSYSLDGLPFELEHHLSGEKLGDLRAWAARYYQHGAEVARKRGRVSCLTVMPGNDQRKAYKLDWFMDRLNGQTYRTLWEEAVRAKPDWIVITSWNEWPEGTEIEPSLELGDQYLKITAEYAKPFLESSSVAVPQCVPPPKFAPGTTQALDKIFAGRKVGVIIDDRFTDAEFWAAYCGATVQRLAWKDLIDPKFFNASNFPVLIHTAHEHYTSSVKTTDDVSRSFVRYLHEGGFLVSLPMGTWPLLYDDSRKGVPHGITDTLALGIDNGFEQPPGGVQLTFHAKTNVLFGLPTTASFPKTGDLRFRPTNRTRVPAADAYVPLIQLKDNTGKTQGDAVAYVEHRTSPLSPGKSIYVWMRTAEAFDPEIFLPSLYQFVSTRLKPLPPDNP